MKSKNPALALVLALLTALSVPASFVARAQSGREGVAAPAAVAARKPNAPMPPEEGHGYVVSMVDGRVVCRDASPAERLEILRRDPNVRTSPVRPASDGLQSDASGPGTGVDAVTSNLIPGHLDIVLRPTAELQKPENAHVLAAFERAAAVWENLITSEITVVIDVDYGTKRFGADYGEDVLGSTSGGIFYIPSYTSVRSRLVARATPGAESNIIAQLPPAPSPTPGVPTDSGLLTEMDVSSPLARALGAIAAHANPRDTTGNDRLGSAPSIGFNSKYNFDFDPTDDIAPGKSDFDAVVVHELGHVLGFDSEVGYLELEPKPTLRPTVWDLFRFRPGTTVGSFATAQRVLTTGGEHRYFDGVSELALSTGNPKGEGGDGEQASHWKDDRLNGNVYIGIMDPTLSPGVRRQMTANDRRALDFMGYNMGALPAAPGNDNFVNAVTLQGASGSVIGSNVGATREAGEPPALRNVTEGGRSVWYNWTSPVTGTATFDTLGSSFDTTLSAFTGSAVNALSLPLAGNDDIDSPAGNVASRIQFPVAAGTAYRIMVDGYNGDSGSVVLNWTATGTQPTPQVFNVTGRVTDAAGNGIAGVRVGLSGPPLANGLQYAANMTDASGNYTILNLLSGVVYTVSPIPDGQYSFSPGPVTFSGAGANMVFNFSASAGNPIDGSARFVEQHYQDFLGRAADAPGLAHWTNDIESCQGNLACRDAKRINVSAAFFLSIEFQETGYLVHRMNKAAYGDAGDPSTGLVVPVLKREVLLQDAPLIGRDVVVGQGTWVQQLETNKTSYAQIFVQRPVFMGEYPATMTAGQFVEKLYVKAGIAPTPAERSAALAAFGPGGVAGRAAALRSVAESSTLDRAEKNRAFVLMQYFGYLRRNPNDAPEANLNYAGWNFWLGKLNEFGGDFVRAEMVKAFLDSAEYRRRFGQ